MNHLSIVGAGSWGTALAITLGPRFERVRLWVHDPDLAQAIQRTRENILYLPGFQLPPNVEPTHNLQYAVESAAITLLVVPSSYLRSVFRRLVPYAQSDTLFISATKGIENGSLLRMTQIMEQEAAAHYHARVGALSGPTFAREIASGEPAAVVISSHDAELAVTVQSAFSGPCFRLYTNDDPAGVEIGAALKNVIAIAAGIVHGLGLGSNTMAALITRGLAEIGRLATALGGRPETLAGLAGLGDLVLTCTGQLSRNRMVGVELAKGNSLETILSTNMVAEGVETTAAAVELASRHDVEMPITRQMYAILRLGKAPRDGIRELMERSLKRE